MRRSRNQALALVWEEVEFYVLLSEMNEFEVVYAVQEVCAM